MKKRMFTLFAAFAMTIVSALAAQALPFQTFVSSTGNDASDCTQSTPCRTFAGAVPKTSTRGVITALDSGTYGIVTIDKALTIQAAPGVYAVLSGGREDDVVTINTPDGEDVVVLRNLHIMSRSIADNMGVIKEHGGALHVESCVIEGFRGSRGFGIVTFGTSFVIDTILRDNGTGILTGVGIASIDHCRIEHNLNGILIDSGTAMIRDSVVVGNSDFGVKAGFIDISGGGIENCMVAYNGTGIRHKPSEPPQGAPPFFVLYVSSTMITNNHVGVSGDLVSFGNNRLAGNITNGSMSTIPQQ